MLCMFSALHHNSVHVVLVWTTAGGAAIEATVTALLGPGPGHPAAPIPREAALLLLVGFSAGGKGLSVQDPGFRGFGQG